MLVGDERLWLSGAIRRFTVPAGPGEAQRSNGSWLRSLTDEVGLATVATPPAEPDALSLEDLANGDVAPCWEEVAQEVATLARTSSNCGPSCRAEAPNEGRGELGPSPLLPPLIQSDAHRA